LYSGELSWLKITILAENTISLDANAPLLGQHGLAMLLDVQGCGRILFDTGQSDVLMKNLLLLDILPDSIDYVVLSHGHYGHCGGLLSFLRARQMPLTVFAGPGLFSPRYLQKADGRNRFVGMPYTKEFLTASGADFVFTYGPTQPGENMWVSGTLPKITDFEAENLNLVDHSKQTDRFTDEIAFYVVRPEGLVVITGCSHRGLVNIIKYGQRVSKVEKVHAVIGGAQLEHASEWQRDATLGFLREISPDIVGLNHCTGASMHAALCGAFGSRVVKANTGDIINI
jgi:7,8-dihydropterin-6-yl-methyl-4-(beta-D-ribofuranosyl)aminobenzene 5'-phosphate synthase